MSKTQTVRILKGVYAKTEYTNVEVDMISAPKKGSKGIFVTVDPSAFGFSDRKSARVMLDSFDDVEYLDGSAVNSADADIIDIKTSAPVVERPKETKDEAIERIRTRFETLDTMTHAVCDGIVRGMIVSGPPGIGKSFGVEQILEVYESMHSLKTEAAGKNSKLFNKTEVVKGSVTPIGLYQTLYNMKDKGDIVVFDDCDTVLLDDVSLNMLKAALDSGSKRTISWKSESAALKREGIPDRFEFKAGVIFITNLDFEKTTSKRLKPHLDALISRCHYLDLDMHSLDDCFIRIEQILADGMLQDRGFSKDGEAEVVDFMRTNSDRLQEVSLRMVLKIADLKQMVDNTPNSTQTWQQIASMTCVRKGQNGVR